MRHDPVRTARTKATRRELEKVSAFMFSEFVRGNYYHEPCLGLSIQSSFGGVEVIWLSYIGTVGVAVDRNSVILGSACKYLQLLS